MTRRQTNRAVIVLAAFGAATVLSGCSSDDNVKAWSPPTPELQTVVDSHDEVHNKLERNLDFGRRQITEDFARAVYWDRPSRLMNKPTPY
ncbi:MAG: hypothetical protein CMJ31_06915 [Phycisphaerae bacterium]|nr:hypothetical protein [Phycisphaerae bacterium]